MMYRDTVQGLGMLKSLTTTTVFVSMPNGDEATYEVLPNGWILQFDVQSSDPVAFCRKFKFPYSAIRTEKGYEDLITGTSWFLGGQDDLGYLNESHLEGAVAISEPKHRDPDRILESMAKSQVVFPCGASLGADRIVCSRQLQSRYPVRKTRGSK